MKTLKRTSILIVISMFVFLSAFNPVISGSFVYADSPDTWTQVTTNEQLVEAFRYYCKSRNLAIEGSALDTITSVTTSAFNNICNISGIDMTALQAHIKWAVYNGQTKFLFDTTGITAYNRIFAEFLQNNDIDVGEAVDEVLEQGEFVLDAEGHGAFVYVVSTLNSNSGGSCSAHGSTYKYTSKALETIALQNGQGVNIPVYYKDNNGNKHIDIRFSVYSKTYITANMSRYDLIGGQIKFIDNQNNINKNLSHMAILKYGNNYYCGVACDYVLNMSTGSISNGYTWFAEPNWYFYPYQNKGNQTVTIFSTTINNNDYSNNTYTVINNDGDTYNYDDDDEPPVEPIEPTPPDPDDKWDIEVPDLDVNWILSGKENKFPFNIPFNIMFALSLLNAEPEAPHFQGTINLGIVQWNYDIDLSPYNNVAVLCRNLEFLLFIIGLMFATKQLIWG